MMETKCQAVDHLLIAAQRNSRVGYHVLVGVDLQQLVRHESGMSCCDLSTCT